MTNHCPSLRPGNIPSGTRVLTFGKHTWVGGLALHKAATETENTLPDSSLFVKFLASAIYFRHKGGPTLKPNDDSINWSSTKKCAHLTMGWPNASFSHPFIARLCDTTDAICDTTDAIQILSTYPPTPTFEPPQQLQLNRTNSKWCVQLRIEHGVPVPSGQQST